MSLGKELTEMSGKHQVNCKLHKRHGGILQLGMIISVVLCSCTC